MVAMRRLVTLVRVLGMAALALVVLAWMAPARFSRWFSHAAPAVATPAPVSVPERTAPTTSVHAASMTVATAPVPPYSVVPEDDPAPVLISPPAAAMARWLGAKYHVSAAVIGTLIVEADRLSKAYHLSPNLIIAVMAIESNFHPYIQSEAGAQGLMQVMPVIHAKRYARFGGKSSFIDPIVSLKVGAEILRDCVRLKGGSETEALRFYFGGGAASDVYIDKVRSEQRKLNQVAAGLHAAAD
jgi:soluble lytic murein transglycosylase-like protein